MKAAIFFLAALFASTALRAEARADQLEFSDGVQALAVWETGPMRGSESRMRLSWYSGEEKLPYHPQAFRVRLWMPSHGHGSSPVEIRPVTKEDGSPAPGVFLISRIYFTMGGHWEVQVTLRRADGSDETRSVPVSLGSGHH